MILMSALTTINLLSSKNRHIFSVKGRMVNTLGFESQMVSIATTLPPLRESSHRLYINRHDYVPIKLYLQKPAVSQMWPAGQSFLTPAVEDFIWGTELLVRKYEDCVNNMTSVKLLTKLNIINSSDKIKRNGFQCTQKKSQCQSRGRF